MNLSLLVHTFNKYQFLWPGSLQAWRIAYTETCLFYWGTDEPGHEKYDFGKFQVLYSGKNEWSDRLITLLNHIPTDYVLYAQEDHWPTAHPPDLSEMMRIMTQKGLKRLQLSPIVQFYSLTGSELPLFFHPKSKYLVSHQPSIWDRKFFISCLERGQTPWVNEYEGSKTLSKLPEIQGKIAIWPCNWFHHACIQGKLVEPQQKAPH
jgi:hypothetical protein